MDIVTVLIILGAVYLAPHLDKKFAKVLSAVCVLLAVGVVAYKLLV